MTKKNLTYKEALEELQTIVSLLESNKLEVDEMTEKIERASYLFKFCKNLLQSTQNNVEKVLKDLENEGRND